MLYDIIISNSRINHFLKSSEHFFLYNIIKNDYETDIILYTYHNLIEIFYVLNKENTNEPKRISRKCFRVTSELLDLLFDKYKDNSHILFNLTKFCLASRKSRQYWNKIKNTPIANEVMATILGSKNEN